MKKIITFFFVLASMQAFSQSTTIVISQIYGAGGNTGALFNADYVELHNVSGTAQSLSGFSIQYGSATGTTFSGVSALPASSIPAGGYYLIQMSTVGTIGSALTPDNIASPSIAMAAGAGKVALVNGTTAITACNVSNIIDFVGYGSTATCWEGSGPTATISATLAAFRNNNGCTDTNDNASDFSTATPAPRNGSTTPFICGGGSPSLTLTTSLPGFGSVCINTTSAAGSFVISGSNLTSAPLTVAALTGFTYSTTLAGSYTTTLSIPQAGGNISQTIYVKFSPTLIQLYSGNILVGGGGVASAINVPASGTGVNSVPVLTTGAASAITTTTATCAGTITSIGCSAITSTYGIEYSTSNGFPNGSGTPVLSTNLSGNAFTSNLTGLTPGTVYYYHSYAANSGGTGYGTQQTFTTLSAPALTASALATFGNVCINTTGGPNTFTITGTNLTNANVTVGPFTGYTFSTALAGPYTPSLNLTQPGNSYSQLVYVNFSPLLVQSYSGNIPVGGGGTTAPINVPVTGIGVNSAPSLTSGAASAITTTSATVAGTITSIGCSAVTAYGIEYSTTLGFPNGSGTPVSSSNLSGGNFSSNLAGLSSNTTYYYHSYATNTGGTGYGTEQFFTTQSTTPALSATSLAPFNSVCINTTAGPNSFTINGSALTAASITVAALNGYTYSTTSGGSYTTTLTLTQGGGTFTQVIWVKFTPTAAIPYNGNIVISGGGTPSSVNVPASGAGVNTTPTVTSGAASAITSISATVAGTLPTTGCSSITAYGVEFSTTNGFPNGTGTPVASTNLAGINFSSNLTGLAPTTVYYYHAYATNNGGTVYGAQGTFTTAAPILSANALTAFGNVCTNTTAGPNTFTITGTNLTAANVNVGPLNGFTFSTTSGGTYSASLNLTQASGPYSQVIYVKFSPVAVQSYSGNIPVNGGGAVAITVSASGAGVNTAPAVTSGTASAITQVSATVAGTIPSTGCTALTVYGIEYSTTNGFSNGSGTPAVSTNLSGVNFTSSLTGLFPSTTYYYHAYATNGGGTVYGTQGSFTTAAPVLTATPITAGFGAVCLNTTVGPNSFTLNSTALTNANVNVGPLTGYTFSTSATGPFTQSLSLAHAGGVPYSQTIYVQFTPVAVQSYTGNIPVSGGGALVTINVAVTGNGINTVSSLTTGSATVNSPNTATVNGTINSIGCSAVTAYGFEYSGINGFANGQGTKVYSTNLGSGNFSAMLNGLVQNSTYYYKAFAINNGGIAYGTQQSFTTTAIPTGLVIYSTPLTRGGNVHYTLDGINPGHYAVRMINSLGQVAFQKDFIVGVNFIDFNFTLPAVFGTGVYSFQVAGIDFRTEKQVLVW